MPKRRTPPPTGAGTRTAPATAAAGPPPEQVVDLVQGRPRPARRRADRAPRARALPLAAPAGDVELRARRIGVGDNAGGEVVSPILSDDPRCWEQIERVCEIVRRHGGQVDQRCGAHVHVSNDSLDTRTWRWQRLARLVAGYEDVLFRMTAAGPTHRGRSTRFAYAQPMSAGDFPRGARRQDIDQSRRSVSPSRYAALNLTNPHTVEFRHFDGTLDPRRIQANVMVASAIVDAARRMTRQRDPDGLMPAAPMPLGQGARGGAVALRVLAMADPVRPGATSPRPEVNSMRFRWLDTDERPSLAILVYPLAGTRLGEADCLAGAVALLVSRAYADAASERAAWLARAEHAVRRAVAAAGEGMCVAVRDRTAGVLYDPFRPPYAGEPGTTGPRAAMPATASRRCRRAADAPHSAGGASSSCPSCAASPARSATAVATSSRTRSGSSSSCWP